MQNCSPFRSANIHLPLWGRGTAAFAVVDEVFLSHFCSALPKPCNNPSVASRQLPLHKGALRERTFPLGKNGRFVNRPYGTHLHLGKNKGRIWNPPKKYHVANATYHACEAGISRRHRGISQKHRFYFTLPKATFHCAIGAIRRLADALYSGLQMPQPL